MHYSVISVHFEYWGVDEYLDSTGRKILANRLKDNRIPTLVGAEACAISKVVSSILTQYIMVCTELLD